MTSGRQPGLQTPRPAQSHRFVDDRSRSIVRGIPLASEPGLGALTLPGLLREVTGRFADREALVHGDDRGEMERWSYRELWQHALAVARALVACGLGKGQRVGILMTNRAEFLPAVFGTALAGGVATPLSTFSTADELSFLLASSGCSILLLEQSVLKKDFTRMLCEIEPAIATSRPGAPRADRFPFLRHIAAIGDGTTGGAIETWQAFIARGEETPAAHFRATG
jgi:acyl-CoA synthetase (AMP-forming)/AMP-acid ligase II